MPTISDPKHSETNQQALPAADSRISELVNSVRLDNYAPSSDAHQANLVPSFLAMSLAGLATLHEQGVISLNFSARDCTLPLVASVHSLSEGVENAIGGWVVEGRTRPHELEHIIRQLRRLGVEAVGLYASPTGSIEEAEYAWICAANYRDLERITPSRPASTAETLIITYEGAFPADFSAPSRAHFLANPTESSDSKVSIIGTPETTPARREQSFTRNE